MTYFKQLSWIRFAGGPAAARAVGPIPYPTVIRIIGACYCFPLFLDDGGLLMVIVIGVC